jgi:uncharacterized protein
VRRSRCCRRRGTTAKETLVTEEEDLVWVDDLEPEICWRLVDRRPAGRIGFVTEGEPVVLPVNHAVDGRSIVIRTGETAMLEALGGGASAAFEVDETDAFSETGWSVLIRGFASEITDQAERADAERLPLHPWAPGRRDRWIRIVPSSVTGRAISRKRSTPEGHLLPYMPAD